MPPLKNGYNGKFNILYFTTLKKKKYSGQFSKGCVRPGHGGRVWGTETPEVRQRAQEGKEGPNGHDPMNSGPGLTKAGSVHCQQRASGNPNCPLKLPLPSFPEGRAMAQQCQI